MAFRYSNVFGVISKICFASLKDKTGHFQTWQARPRLVTKLSSLCVDFPGRTSHVCFANLDSSLSQVLNLHEQKPWTRQRCRIEGCDPSAAAHFHIHLFDQSPRLLQAANSLIDPGSLQAVQIQRPFGVHRRNHGGPQSVARGRSPHQLSFANST
jgi:hypothetical protein